MLAKGRNRFIVTFSLLLIVITFVISILYIYSTKEIFYIPADYEGSLILIEDTFISLPKKNKGDLVFDFQKNNIVVTEGPIEHNFIPIGYSQYIAVVNEKTNFPIQIIDVDPTSKKLNKSEKYVFKYYEKTGVCNSTKYRATIYCRQGMIKESLEQENNYLDSVVCEYNKARQKDL
ncbi:MAG: hypothetical protein KA149_01555 [Chitinophagales bacterium]|nr:hypothetical protein [Chitinophagales bacterium]